MRCPVCGAVTVAGQAICRRCFEPLATAATLPAAPATGETCRMYRAKAAGTLLVLSSGMLEYAAPEIAFHTTWDNAARIAHRLGDDLLQLFHTPTVVRMPLGSGRGWFSDVTRTVPLRQFGYPANAELVADLRRCAPQLQRYL